MKSIIEHFTETPILTQELKDLLVKNYYKDENEYFAENLSGSIHTGFTWRSTDEGYDFWEKIYKLSKEYENSQLQ